MKPEVGGQVRPSTSSIFEDECAYYLHLGMSLEDYWDGEADIVKWYRKKEKHDLEYQNWLAWLNGRYIYETMLAVSPAIKAFVKNPKPAPYPEKPHELFREEGMAQEKKNQQRMEIGFATFQALANRINKAKRKGGDDSDGG